MQKIFFLACCILSLDLYAQKQANIWYFGNQLGLDFNYSRPRVLKDGQIKYCNALDSESSASIADENGNLLFYTDGTSVWDREHDTMPEGNKLLGSCTTTQTLIAPSPGKPDIYYIFTASPQGNDPQFPQEHIGFRYSTIDLSQNNGLGNVSQTNALLSESTTEKIAATRHANGKDIWVVMHEWNNNRFNAYLISEKGVETNPIISDAGSLHTDENSSDNIFGFNAIGQMKLSPNGEKLALVLYEKKIIELFSFDASDGTLKHLRTFSNPGEGRWLYGLEFSPSSELLYFSDAMKYIYQVDLRTNGITVLENEGVFHDQPSQLQLGPDGKIYVAKYDMFFLGIIELPNNSGKSCNYLGRGIELEIDGVHYSKNGLPNFISSYFYDTELYPPKPFFEMPNILTPNGDGFNEEFVPLKFYNITNLRMFIYNRWGKLIYQTSNIEERWDGKNHPSGIYYWKAEFRGINEKKYYQKGVVEIMR